MSVQGFHVDIQNQFQKCMKDLDWLGKTIEQLQKDFQLSGLSLNLDPEVIEFNQLAKQLKSTLNEVKKNNQYFEQLLYRVDLPSGLDAESLATDSLAEVLILRSFQKVWLRKHYSK
jgi:hypothetical protein